MLKPAGEDDSSESIVCLFYVTACRKKCWPRSSFKKGDVCGYERDGRVYKSS